MTAARPGPARPLHSPEPSSRLGPPCSGGATAAAGRCRSGSLPGLWPSWSRNWSPASGWTRRPCSGHSPPGRSWSPAADAAGALTDRHRGAEPARLARHGPALHPPKLRLAPQCHQGVARSGRLIVPGFCLGAGKSDHLADSTPTVDRGPSGSQLGRPLHAIPEGQPNRALGTGTFPVAALAPETRTSARSQSSPLHISREQPNARWPGRRTAEDPAALPPRSGPSGGRCIGRHRSGNGQA